MNPDELDGELERLERQFFDIRTQAVTEKLEDPSLLNKTRRDIARIKTILAERGAEHNKKNNVIEKGSGK